MSRNFTPEQTLIDQLLLDDTSAFEEIHHRYFYPLYSYCFDKTGSPEAAKEIVRDIFISLWEKRHTLPVNFSLSLYLYTEVRRSVVKSINTQLARENEIPATATKVIPGFSIDQLQKARRPVNQPVYAENMASLRSSLFMQKQTDNWWNQYLPSIDIKMIRHAFQKAFNLS